MLLAVLSLGCSGQASSAIALGLTAAAISRANGGCYAQCAPGTRCNHVTGYCDDIPCRGVCMQDEVCDTNGLFHRCVSSKVPLNIVRDSKAPPPTPMLPAPPN
jgi:hypothetical protein